MASRTFTESELESLVYESGVFTREIDEGRWSMFVETVVQADDGKFYLVNWQRGLTENQEDSFPFDGEFPEVFPVEGVYEISTGTYYVEDTSKYSHASDAESIKLLGADTAYKEALDNITVEDIDEFSEKIEKLSVLDPFGDDVSNGQLRIATQEYLSRVKDALKNFG